MSAVAPRFLCVFGILLTACGASVRSLEWPLQPGVIRDDERRAFECFTERLPTLIRESRGMNRSDYVPQPMDSYFTDPMNQRYYVRDEGNLVQFLVVTRSPPPTPVNGIRAICMDGCGAFIVSYSKDASACEAHPVETGGKRGRLW